MVDPQEAEVESSRQASQTPRVGCYDTPTRPRLSLSRGSTMSPYERTKETAFAAWPHRQRQGSTRTYLVPGRCFPLFFLFPFPLLFIPFPYGSIMEL